MDWIRVDAALPTHRKSIELGEILCEPLAWARMVRLWCWAKANAGDGLIEGRNPARLVEAAVGWEGEEGAFVEAALEVGFLCREQGALALHDWQQHNGKALKRAEEAAERTRRWREVKEAERIRKREEEIAASDRGTPSRTHTEPIPNVERDVTRRNVTRRDVTTTTAGPPPPPTQFQLEVQTTDEGKPKRLSPAQTQREELRAMRAAALSNVVDDVEIKPAALTRTFERLEQEATAKGATLRDAYAAFLQDDYARSRNPPCPLPLFVDANKFRECLSLALRTSGKGPPLTLVSGRKAGSYASLAEIEAQNFTVDPVDDRQEAP